MSFKAIGDFCIIIFGILGLCISLAYAYYHYFVDDITIGVNNVGDQIAVDIVNAEDLTTEEIDIYEDRWFMHANYYSNDNENGIELQELQFNYFTGVDLTSNQYRSTGMQYIGDFETYINKVANEEEANRTVFDDFYYYDTTNGISWSGYNNTYGSISTTLNRNESFIIKIDDKPYSIQLTGKYSYKTGWWIFSSTTWCYYGYEDIFANVFDAIESNSFGYGDFYITLDLSDYFTVREYDYDTGKFRADTVSDILKNYVVLKVHYDANGVKNSKQSIYGCISCNPSYGLDAEVNTTYWQERMVYTLDVYNFVYRFSEAHNGYLISLSRDYVSSIKSMPRAYARIVIDLSSEYLSKLNYNIVGIDYNGFEDLPIDSISIIGWHSQDFYILSGALVDTNIKKLTYVQNIKLIISDDAFNNEYVAEVVA